MPSHDQNIITLGATMRTLADEFTAMPEIINRIQEEGLGHHHARILHTIATEGELSMSALARKIKLSDSSATLLVDQLVARKLVQRIRPEEDRRVVRVGVTKRGEKVADEIAQSFVVMARRILEALDAKEREAYLQLTLKIAGALKNSNQT